MLRWKRRFANFVGSVDSRPVAVSSLFPVVDRQKPIQFPISSFCDRGPTVRVPKLFSSRLKYDLWIANHGDSILMNTFESREEAMRKVVTKVIKEEFGYYTLVTCDEFKRLNPPPQ